MLQVGRATGTLPWAANKKVNRRRNPPPAGPLSPGPLAAPWAGGAAATYMGVLGRTQGLDGLESVFGDQKLLPQPLGLLLALGFGALQQLIVQHLLLGQGDLLLEELDGLRLALVLHVQLLQLAHAQLGVAALVLGLLQLQPVLAGLHLQLGTPVLLHGSQLLLGLLQLLPQALLLLHVHGCLNVMLGPQVAQLQLVLHLDALHHSLQLPNLLLLGAGARVQGGLEILQGLLVVRGQRVQLGLPVVHEAHVLAGGLLDLGLQVHHLLRVLFVGRPQLVHLRLVGPQRLLILVPQQAALPLALLAGRQQSLSQPQGLGGLRVVSGWWAREEQALLQLLDLLATQAEFLLQLQHPRLLGHRGQLPGERETGVSGPQVRGQGGTGGHDRGRSREGHPIPSEHRPLPWAPVIRELNGPRCPSWLVTNPWLKETIWGLPWWVQRLTPHPNARGAGSVPEGGAKIRVLHGAAKNK